MTDNSDPFAGFFASDAKVSKCRRQGDQLDYFAHAYCKFYGDCRDAEARASTLRSTQNLTLVLGAALGIPLLIILSYLRVNQLIIGAVLMLGAGAGYLLVEHVRREHDHVEQLNRERESFGLSAYLTGIDLPLEQLEESIAKNSAGHWNLTAAYGPWRAERLRQIFQRVYGVPVPGAVIDRICPLPA